MEPVSSALAGRFFSTEALEQPCHYFLKNLMSRCNHILRHWGLGIQCMILHAERREDARDTVVPILHIVDLIILCHRQGALQGFRCY